MWRRRGWTADSSHDPSPRRLAGRQARGLETSAENLTPEAVLAPVRPRLWLPGRRPGSRARRVGSLDSGPRPPAGAGVELEAGPGCGAGPPCSALLGAPPGWTPTGKTQPPRPSAPGTQGVAGGRVRMRERLWPLVYGAAAVGFGCWTRVPPAACADYCVSLPPPSSCDLFLLILVIAFFLFVISEFNRCWVFFHSFAICIVSVGILQSAVYLWVEFWAGDRRQVFPALLVSLWRTGPRHFSSLFPHH